LLASPARRQARPALWLIFFFSSRRRHTRWPRDWSSDVCSSDLVSDDEAPSIARHGYEVRLPAQAFQTLKNSGRHVERPDRGPVALGNPAVHSRPIGRQGDAGRIALHWEHPQAIQRRDRDDLEPIRRARCQIDSPAGPIHGLLAECPAEVRMAVTQKGWRVVLD